MKDVQVNPMCLYKEFPLLSYKLTGSAGGTKTNHNRIEITPETATH